MKTIRYFNEKENILIAEGIRVEIDKLGYGDKVKVIHLPEANVCFKDEALSEDGIEDEASRHYVELGICSLISKYIKNSR